LAQRQQPDILHLGLTEAELEEGPVAARFVAVILQFQTFVAKLEERVVELEKQVETLTDERDQQDGSWKVYKLL
jgi:hypothetical protein